MIATLINSIAVIAGALLGLLFGKRIKDSFKEIVMTSAGAVTLILGIDMAMKGESVIALLFALIIGGMIGSSLRIEDGILSIGNRFAKDSDGGFAKGFLDSSILFCSGSMSIIGSINAGTTGDYSLILIKSIMDGFMAIVFASAYGKGVLLSSAVVFVYQGFFTIFGAFLAPRLGDSGIGAIAAAGGYLLIMLALGLLKMKSIKTADFLPALVLAPIFSYLFAFLN